MYIDRNAIMPPGEKYSEYYKIVPEEYIRLLLKRNNTIFKNLIKNSFATRESRTNKYL